MGTAIVNDVNGGVSIYPPFMGSLARLGSLDVSTVLGLARGVVPTEDTGAVFRLTNGYRIEIDPAAGTQFDLDSAGRITGGQIDGFVAYDDEDAVIFSYTGFSAPLDDSLAIALALPSANIDGYLGDFFSGADHLVGTSFNDVLLAGSGDDTLEGKEGNNTLAGQGGRDRAVYDGARDAYTVTEVLPGTSVYRVAGTDGTDSLVEIEGIQFSDGEYSLLGELRDYDGNYLGASSDWKQIGAADVQNDGDTEVIYVNETIGRWATLASDRIDTIDFNDHGEGGDTRVVGIYIDPLVESGDVVRFSAFDSQQRFQNDLAIDNLSGVLGADDYDGDGLQEVYFSLSDNTAYLHAYMHADGNIRYANYQSEEQVVDFMTANGYDASAYADWFAGS